MTFSIAGRCPVTGGLGVAVTTSSIAVGARCPWVRTGVGAVSTQNITDPMLGTRVLEMLDEGEAPKQALDHLARIMPFMAYRQLIAINGRGETASFSGGETLGVHGRAEGENCVAAGNLLSNDGVPQAVVDGFLADKGAHLADHLLAGLEAGLDAGGEEGPLRSSALLVTEDQDWPEVSLRIDWTESCPIEELTALWRAYAPQKYDYVKRAVDPAAAPGFGAPGDE